MAIGNLAWAFVLLCAADAPADAAPSPAIARECHWICYGEGRRHTRLFVRSFVPTPSDRSPILLLHFTSGHSGLMAPLALELAKRGYPVYAMDLLAHGRTTGPHASPRDDMAALDAVTNWISSRHGGRCVGLAGTSYGGDLAVAYALWQATHSHQPRVGSIVGQGLITPWQRHLAIRYNLGMWLIQRTQPAPVQFLLPPRIRTDWLFRLFQLYDDRESRREFRRDPLRTRAYPPKMVVRAFRYRPEIPSTPVSTPLLVLEGGRDRLVPPGYESRVHKGLCRIFPHCEFALMEGAPHGMFVEDQSAVADILENWFQRTLISVIPETPQMGKSDP